MGRLWGLLEAAQVQFRWFCCAVQAPVPGRLVPRLPRAGGRGAAQAGGEEEPQPEVGGAGQQQVVSDSGSDYGSDGSVYNVTKLSYRPSQGEAATRGQEEWRDLLMKAGAAIALVTFAREGANKGK